MSHSPWQNKKREKARSHRYVSELWLVNMTEMQKQWKPTKRQVSKEMETTATQEQTLTSKKWPEENMTNNKSEVRV